MHGGLGMMRRRSVDRRRMGLMMRRLMVDGFGMVGRRAMDRRRMMRLRGSRSVVGRRMMRLRRRRGLVVRAMMRRRRRRGVVIARAVVNDDDVVRRDDAADQRNRHHTGEQCGDKTHRASLSTELRCGYGHLVCSQHGIGGTELQSLLG
jgi:hypothetical protein